DLSPVLRIDCVLVQGRARARQAPAAARVDLEEALSFARGEGIRRIEGAALFGLGTASRFAGELETARRLWLEALDVVVALGDRDGESWCLNNLGVSDMDEERFTEARARLLRVVDLAREAKKVRPEAAALGNLGVAAHELGDLDAAAAYYRRAV